MWQCGQFDRHAQSGELLFYVGTITACANQSLLKAIFQTLLIANPFAGSLQRRISYVVRPQCQHPCFFCTQ